jgi:hypothetical protein
MLFLHFILLKLKLILQFASDEDKKIYKRTAAYNHPEDQGG